MDASTEQGAALQQAARDGGEAERLIYADWLDENGDAELAAIVRVSAELLGAPEQRLWTGERSLPGPFHPDDREVALPLDLTAGVALMRLVAALARSRPYPVAAAALAPWYPAAGEVLTLRQEVVEQANAGPTPLLTLPAIANEVYRLNWESFRTAALAQRAGRLEAAGLYEAADYVRRRRSEVIWSQTTPAGVRWAPHPLFWQTSETPPSETAPCTPHWVDEAPPESVAAANGPEFGVGPWYLLCEPAQSNESKFTSLPIETLVAQWRAAGELFVRLAGEGAINCIRPRENWLDRFSLLDHRRIDEYNVAADAWQHSTSVAGGNEARAAVLDEFTPLAQAAYQAWYDAASIRPLHAAAKSGATGDKPARGAGAKRGPRLIHRALRWLGVID